MNHKLETTFKSTLKSTDTEELIDIYFYRPIGYRWALFFHKIGITPNQITIASIFIGIVSGVCFYFQDLYINLLGIFLLIWANSFDSADGQLARMTNQKSTLGRILDGACGVFWFASIYIAIICRSEWNFIFCLALFAGFWHLKQTSMADYYRNLHLLFLKGKNGSELDNSKTLAEKYNQKKWKKHPFSKLFELIYLNYTEEQEHWTPELQKLLNLINTKHNGDAPIAFREAFRKESLSLIKYTNLLSFNLRSIALFICILVKYPWVYFIFEITVMNIMLFYMINRYENICHNYLDKL